MQGTRLLCGGPRATEADDKNSSQPQKGKNNTCKTLTIVILTWLLWTVLALRLPEGPTQKPCVKQVPGMLETEAGQSGCRAPGEGGPWSSSRRLWPRAGISSEPALGCQRGGGWLKHSEKRWPGLPASWHLPFATELASLWLYLINNVRNAPLQICF